MSTANIHPNVIEAANAASDDHPDDVGAAVRRAMTCIENMNEYPDVVRSLVEHAVRELVYARRHALNRQVKNTLGVYHTTAKVDKSSRVVREMYASLYSYHLAGKTLGSMTKSELTDTAASELRSSEGHKFNSVLCQRLAILVPDGSTVKEAVSVKKLEEVFAFARSQSRTSEPAA